MGGYLRHAFRAEQERAAWERWLSILPLMTTGQIPWKPFEKYRDSLIGPENVARTRKTPEEIEAELGAVVAGYEARRGR